MTRLESTKKYQLQLNSEKMKFFNIIKATLVRIVLLIHSLLAIWRVVNIAGNQKFWYLAIADGAFLIEGLLTIIARRGMEYKWYGF